MLTNRRSFFRGALAASSLSLLRASDTITAARVSAITDEVSRSEADSITFAHNFGLKWLALRDVPAPLGSPKHGYYSLEPAAMKEAARNFNSAGIGISFLDTPFLKFDLPGTQPALPAKDPAKRLAQSQAKFAARIADLRQGIVAGQTFNCPKVRIFTFTRVANPESLYPRLADIVGEMAGIAEKEGIRLLIENEASQNVGTSAETAKFIKMVPSNVGINWDTLNGLELGEKPYPDGYRTLPIDRVWNVHAKGKSLLNYPQHQDWPGILKSLERDGYKGPLELETHIFGQQQVEASAASMKELLRLLKAGASS